MKITLDRFDDAFGFKARAGNHELILDSDPKIGGSDQGFRPMHLMLVSLAGCSAMDIVHMLRKGKHDIRSYSATVEAERREALPRIFSKVVMEISLNTDASDKVIDRAVTLTKEKYCSAFAILEASSPVEIRVKRV